MSSRLGIVAKLLAFALLGSAGFISLSASSPHPHRFILIPINCFTIFLLMGASYHYGKRVVTEETDVWLREAKIRLETLLKKGTPNGTKTSNPNH